MSKVYEGDEWKRAANEPVKGRTRAQEQEYVNTEFCNGRMELAEWRRRTDELSEPTRWSTAGKIK